MQYDFSSKKTQLSAKATIRLDEVNHSTLNLEP